MLTNRPDIVVPNLTTSKTTRRAFLQHSALTTAGCIVAGSFSRPQIVQASSINNRMRIDEAPLDDVPITDDPRVKQTLQRAIDAAISEGASYSDARLTHTRTRLFLLNSQSLAMSVRGSVADYEEITIGVRALVNGCWGFASGPVWSVSEGERLGKEAFHQAITNTLGKPRTISLAPVEVVKNGTWTMPVKIDPFTVHPSQLNDILRGVLMFASNKPGVNSALNSAEFVRQDKAMASSEGSYFSQRTYSASGAMGIEYGRDGVKGQGQPDFITPSGLGFELFDEDRLRDSIDPLIEDIKWNASLPVLPLDVGRYETVFDASAIAALISGSIGAATELDRALGFEANAGGTSYLDEPAEMLGSYMVGSKLLSVTADRSTPGWLSTVRWDDEGVAPIATPLITNGVLTNYQTTRQDATWTGVAKPGTPARSSGCAYAPFGVYAPLAHTANLRMQSGTESQDFNGLVATMQKGVAVKGAAVSLDFQQLNGAINANFYDVVKGKIVARLANAGILFRSPELWKGIKAIGIESSRRSYGFGSVKGEPPQNSSHTVSAVPVVHEGLTYIDPTRKA